MDLSKKEILVAGGGKIAARRVETLCGFAGHITVAAPVISERLRELAKTYPITLIEQPFAEEMLAGMDLVLAATDDRELNRRIVLLGRKRGCMGNTASEKEWCDFYFPSVVQTDELVIGINASGENHGLVKQTRLELEEFLKR